MPSERQRLEQLWEQLIEAERRQARHADLQQRLRALQTERASLEVDLVQAQRTLSGLRFGLRGIWHALLGDRSEHVRRAAAWLARLGDRSKQNADRLPAIERQLAEANASGAAGNGRDALHAQIDAEVARQRVRWQAAAPGHAAQLSTIDAELPNARAERAAAEHALTTAQEISRLLASAHADLDAALEEYGLRSLAGFFQSAARYRPLRARTDLKNAGRLMNELRILDAVRDDLVALEPNLPRWFADDFSWRRAWQPTAESMEYAIDGIVEARKLFDEIEPTLLRNARAARNEAQRLERRRIDLLIGDRVAAGSSDA